MFDRGLRSLSRVTHFGDAHDPTWLFDGAQVSFFSFKSQGGPLVAVTLRTQPDLAVVSRTIVVQDLGHDEADNHANYDVHPKEGRFVIAKRDSDAGVIAVFDWVAVVAQPVIPGAGPRDRYRSRG